MHICSVLSDIHTYIYIGVYTQVVVQYKYPTVLGCRMFSDSEVPVMHAVTDCISIGQYISNFGFIPIPCG